MVRKEWAIELDGAQHAVAFERGTWSGKQTVSVDGVPVVRKGMPLYGKIVEKDIPFVVAGHDCYVRTNSTAFSHKFDLIVDGQSRDSGAYLGPSTPLPIWAWCFIIACGLMAKVGGIIGVPFGLGGAYACRNIARNPADSPGMRAALCGAVTFACWAAYLLVAVVVTNTLGLFGG